MLNNNIVLIEININKYKDVKIFFDKIEFIKKRQFEKIDTKIDENFLKFYIYLLLNEEYHDDNIYFEIIK